MKPETVDEAGRFGVSPDENAEAREAQVVPARDSVSVATTLDELAGLRTDWLKVRSRCIRPTPDADPDRFRAALAAAIGEVSPYVAIFRVGGEPRGAIVAQVSRHRISCSLGYFRLWTPALRCLECVYGGVMADHACLPAGRLIDHLCELLRSGCVDRVGVNHERVDGPLYAPMIAAGAAVTDVLRHWRFELVPGSYDDTIAAFSKKHRYNMRRADRLLVEHFRGDVRLRVFTRPEDVDEFTRGAAELNSHTYQAALKIGFSDSPLWRNILCVEAEHGRMRCYWLEGGGRPIAFQVGVLYGRTYFLERVAFLPCHADLSPGAVLHVRVIQDLCAAGAERMDYGFGHAQYKQAYGTDFWNESNLCFSGRGLRTRFSRGMERAVDCANRIALGAVRLARVEHRLRRIWRRRLGDRGTEVNDA